MVAMNVMRLMALVAWVGIFVTPAVSFAWHKPSDATNVLFRSKTRPLIHGKTLLNGGVRKVSSLSLSTKPAPAKKKALRPLGRVLKLPRAAAAKLYMSFRNYLRFMIASLRHFWKREKTLTSSGPRQQAAKAARRLRQKWCALIMAVFLWNNAMPFLPQPTPPPLVPSVQMHRHLRDAEITKSTNPFQLDLTRYFRMDHQTYAGHSVHIQQEQDIHWKREGLNGVNGVRFSHEEVDPIDSQLRRDLTNDALHRLVRNAVDNETPMPLKRQDKNQTAMADEIDDLPELVKA